MLDQELDELLSDLPALVLEGARGIGKTSTAERRGATSYRLDDPSVLDVVRAQPDMLGAGSGTIIIDEWQRFPYSWDFVRREVDRDPSPGRFVLTGSAIPLEQPAHTGAGRIVSVRMRPLTLGERGMERPKVATADLLQGGREPLEGTTEVKLEDYTAEILTGGFPGMRNSSLRAQRAALDGYLQRVVDVDVAELGVDVRHPGAMRRWLRSYAACTASVASYEKIRDGATPGEDDKPVRATTAAYREALERIWILDPLEAWAPTNNRLKRLTLGPKHHLADPALAARLVGVEAGSLLRGEGPTAATRDGTFLGALFESLATLCVRVAAQANEARVQHFRSWAGEHEVDLIVERGDGRFLGIEVKMAATIDDADVKHLLWLRHEMGDEMLDAVVLTTGSHAYRRSDGVAVVPLALLGP